MSQDPPPVVFAKKTYPGLTRERIFEYGSDFAKSKVETVWENTSAYEKEEQFRDTVPLTNND